MTLKTKLAINIFISTVQTIIITLVFVFWGYKIGGVILLLGILNLLKFSIKVE